MPNKAIIDSISCGKRFFVSRGLKFDPCYYIYKIYSEKMPKTRIRGIGIKFDTDPPKLTPPKRLRLEFEGSGSNLTPILRKNA